MKVWLFLYYLTIFIFLFKKIESGNKKLPKSFDEIFGKGWEEKGQNADADLENGDSDQKNGIGQCQTNVLVSDQNKNLDKINEEARNADQNENVHNNKDQSKDDQQKREIIRKFQAIKEKIKQKGVRYSPKEWTKIDCTIARKLGTCRNYIYKWEKEFEMGSRIFDESKKYGLIQKFIEMTNEYKQKRKHSRKEWAENYAEMSKKLGVCYGTIKRWKKEIGIESKKVIINDQQKIEIIHKFDSLKEKRNQIGKQSRKEWNQFDCIIAKKLGTNPKEIYNWKKKFGLGRRNHYSNEEKLVKVAKTLQIGHMNLRNWKRQFREEEI